MNRIKRILSCGVAGIAIAAFLLSSSPAIAQQITGVLQSDRWTSSSSVPARTQEITGVPGSPSATTTIQGDQIPAPPPMMTSLGERGNVRHHVRGDSPGACARLGGKDVDLTKVSPGDGLTAQCTEAVAMLVEKS